MAECRVKRAIQGYQVYREILREIWNPVLGEELTTQREHGNPEIFKEPSKKVDKLKQLFNKLKIEVIDS